MKVVIKMNNGDIVEFYINEAGVLGTGNYFPKDHKYGTPIKANPFEVEQWLLHIDFRDEKEMANLIRNLMEYHALWMEKIRKQF
jgi:hypothetical protein